MRKGTLYERSGWAQMLKHNHGAQMNIESSFRGRLGESVGQKGVYRVSNCYRDHQLPLVPYTKKGFNEQIPVPSGEPCCHESCSISVPFHPAFLLQTWRSLFLPSPQRESKYDSFNSLLPPSNADFNLVEIYKKALIILIQMIISVACDHTLYIELIQLAR